MMGIDIDRVIVFAFVLGSALAGRGRGALRAARADLRRDRLPRRAEGLHRRGDRRHRLDPGRDGGRAHPRLRRGLHAGLHLDEVVRPARLRDPDRASCSSGPRASSARPTSGRCEASHVDSERLGRLPHDAARGRRRGERRRGRRRARRSAATSGSPATASAATRRGGVLGTLEQRLARRPLVGVADALRRDRLPAPARLRERLHPPRRVRHGRLHAARARAQHRRRLGRAARPRLRRVLRRSAPTRTRCSAPDQYDIHLPTIVVDPARRDRRRRSSAGSSGCRRDG